MHPALRGRLLDRIRALSRPITPMPSGITPRVHSLRGIRVVLWDVYGTMLVSAAADAGGAAHAPRHVEAALESAELDPAEGIGEKAVRLLADFVSEDHRRLRAAGTDFPEVDIREVWRRLLEELRRREGLGRAPGEDSAEIAAVEYECRVNPVWPMPGLVDALTALAGRMRLGIVSNAQFYTPLILEALTGRTLPGLGFEPDLCAWSFEHRVAKPSPKLFESGLSGLRAGEVLMVGNSGVNDIAPARALGIRTALYAGDARSFSPSGGDGADLVVESLGELTRSLISAS